MRKGQTQLQTGFPQARKVGNEFKTKFPQARKVKNEFMTSCPHQGMSEIEFRYSFLWDKEKGSDLVQDPILFYLEASD
jgi:hypothetical protein